MAAHQRLPLLRPFQWNSDSTKARKSPPATERQLPYGNGMFQLLILFSATITLGTYGLHCDSFSLTAGVMDHWCRRPEAFANLSLLEWKNMAIPLDERGQLSHCLIREPPDAGDAAKVVPCSSWEFDMEQFGKNIVSEWDLVCDRRWLIEVARLVCTAATLASLSIVGTLADRVGRKMAVFITIPVVLIAGTGSSVPNDFHFFVAARAVVSASTIALIPPVLAVFYEVIPSSRIPAYVTGATLFSVLMTPTTLFFAELYRAGWAALQLILMIPTCLLLLMYYSLDESPAWLSATGHVKEAERIALRAASLNKVPLQHCRDMIQNYLQAHTENQDSPGSDRLFDLHLRARTVLVAYMSTALCYAYDTFVINSAGVPASDTVMAIGYVVTFVGFLLVIPCLVRFGFRRTVVASGFMFGTLLAVLFITLKENETFGWNCIVVLMRAAATICLSSFLSQAAGAYPVTARSSGMAWTLAFSRIGDTVGQLSTTLVEGRHTDVRLAIAATGMSLFALCAQVLPYKEDWVLQGLRSSGIRSDTIPAPDTTCLMRDTLLPLPKEPVKNRITNEPDKVSPPPATHSKYSIRKSVTASLG